MNTYNFLSSPLLSFYINIKRKAMEFIINKGIIKKSEEGELYPYVLKDIEKGTEFPLNETTMKVHKMQEGDLVEFAGRVTSECIYLAIGGVDFRASMN